MEFAEIIFPDDILEECSFGQRITSDTENTQHWLPLDINNINTMRPTFLCFGGIATTNSRDANYVAKMVQRITPVEGNANIISIIHSHIVGENAARYFDEDKDELFARGIHEAFQIVDAIFLNLLIDKEGNRLMVQDACQNMRNINIFAHCYGHFSTVSYLETALESAMQMLSYTDAEIEQILRAILVVSYESGQIYKSKFTSINVNSVASELWSDVVLDFPNQIPENAKMQGDELEKILNSEMYRTKDPELVKRFLSNNKYALYQNGNNIDLYTNGLTIDGSDHDLSTIYRHITGKMSYYTNETGSAVSDTIGAVLNYALKNSIKNLRSRYYTPLDADEIFKICSDTMQITRTHFGMVADLDFS